MTLPHYRKLNLNLTILRMRHLGAIASIHPVMYIVDDSSAVTRIFLYNSFL